MMEFCVGESVGPIPKVTTSKQAVEGGSRRGNINFFLLENSEGKETVRWKGLGSKEADQKPLGAYDQRFLFHWKERLRFYDGCFQGRAWYHWHVICMSWPGRGSLPAKIFLNGRVTW